jgi:hypothetical protein
MMPATEHRITAADILPPDKFAANRTEYRRALLPVKKNRRVEVGPFVTFYFENFETMWLQIHEMLHIEKGGQRQIEGELEAYNPLIPQGNELVATMMIEIDDPVRRANTLMTLAGIEESVWLDVDGSRIHAHPTEHADRTTAEGKTSSVHWIRFYFSPNVAARFRSRETRVLLEIAHPNYAHIAVLSDQTRAELAKDLT